MLAQIGKFNEQKYMWNHASTSLLISIWSDSAVQKRLWVTLRNQPIWDGIAKCLVEKNFRVNGKQCRTRIKNMLVRYREAKKSGKIAGSGIESYFNDIDRVMMNRSNRTAVFSESTPKSRPISDPLATTRSLLNQHSDQNKDMVQTTCIKSEAPSPQSSDESFQEIQEASNDSAYYKQYFEPTNIVLDENSSSNHTPSAVVHRLVPSVETSCSSKLEKTNEGDTRSDKMSKSARKNSFLQFERTSISQFEKLIVHTIEAQKESVTRILMAQSEFFHKMLETDRERQTRIEVKLDQILDKIDRLVSIPNVNHEKRVTPGTSSDEDQESRMMRLLNRLEWALPLMAQSLSPSHQQLPSRPDTESRMNILLGKLEQIISQQQSSEQIDV